MPLIRSREAPISTTLTRFVSLPMLRAIYGLLLSLGAPLGWIAVQLIAGRVPFSNSQFDPLLYAYMTIATAIVFGTLGYVIGRREDMITQMALRDALTGLYNKRYFKNRLEQEFERHQRHQRDLSLVQIDLDFFKQVNDTYGHEAGDETLRHVARILRENCRQNEVAARVGGEELCIIAIESDAKQAAAMAERLRKLIANRPVTWQDQSIAITASFGIAEASQEYLDPWIVYRAADAALYRAKDSGRNQVCVAQKDDFSDENAEPPPPPDQA